MPDETVNKTETVEETDNTEEVFEEEVALFEEALKAYKAEKKSSEDEEKDETKNKDNKDDDDEGIPDKPDTAKPEKKKEEEKIEIKPESSELDILRQKLADAEAKLAQSKKPIEDIEATLKRLNVDSKGDIAAVIEAMSTGEDVEAVLVRHREQEMRAKAMLEGMPEYQEFIKEKRQKELDKIYAADLEIVKRADSSVTAASIRDIPNYDKFAAYRIKGIPPEEAYKLANFDTLTAKKAAAKAENAASKDHLKPTGGHGAEHDDGTVDVPADRLREMKSWYPGETSAQLRVRYNNILKRQSAARGN